MGIPSTVAEATAEYREEEDEIGEFISEMCFDYGRCDRKLLYAAHKDWTGMGGTKFPLKHKAFASWWPLLRNTPDRGGGYKISASARDRVANQALFLAAI